MDKKKRIYFYLVLTQLFITLYILLIVNIGGAVKFYQASLHSVFFILLGATVFNLMLAREMIRVADQEKSLYMALVKQEESEKLNAILMSKSHDFLNHLQVVMGLVQLNYSREATDYIKNLSGEIRQIQKVVTLARPDVAALLSSKLAVATGVRANFFIQTDLSGLEVPAEKMTSILGNLIDNALFEAHKHNDLWLNVEISEEEGNYFFEITNPGVIPAQAFPWIFEPGYTTKGSKGTGMGLFIVKNLVTECGGAVECRSTEEEGTMFTVQLPKVKADAL
ncbi:MAG: sensor histidine kinase [Bacillota bacterium]